RMALARIEFPDRRDSLRERSATDAATATWLARRGIHGRWPLPSRKVGIAWVCLNLIEARSGSRNPRCGFEAPEALAAAILVYDPEFAVGDSTEKRCTIFFRRLLSDPAACRFRSAAASLCFGNLAERDESLRLIRIDGRAGAGVLETAGPNQ